MLRFIFRFFIFIAFFLTFKISHAQYIVSDTLLRSFSFTQIDSLLAANGIPAAFVNVNYEVDFYKIIYNTTDVLGNPTIASGAAIIPKGEVCKMPMASYQHGTVSHKNGAPSRFSQETLIGILMASDGVFTIMPDYLGLGDSPGLHPYQHSATEASAVIDYLRAGKEFASDKSFNLSEQLFLFGYSQGGHSTMAAVREIEANLSNEFQITASAPMSGAYDMSGAQTDVLLSNDPYPTPSYLPYLLLGYQEAYGNLFTNYDEVFISPYDTAIPPLFYSGTNSTGFINNQLPSVPKNMIVPAQLDSFINNPLTHPLRIALRDNDLLDWIPQAPMRIYYCGGDDQVNPQNSVNAYNNFIAAGATNVDLINVNNTANHNGCVQPTMLVSRFWFDSLKVLKNGLEVELDITHATASNAANGEVDITVSGGNPPYQISWSSGTNFGLQPGAYSVTVTDSTGCFLTRDFSISPGVGIERAASVSDVLTISPNPMEDFAVLKISGAGTYDVNILNILGKIEREYKGIATGELMISRGDLLPGIYLVEVVGEQRQSVKLLVR